MKCNSLFPGSKEEDHLSSGLNHIQISSGTRTYRIPSPTRSHAPISRNSFSSPTPPSVRATPEKGFYISFDDDSPPKRPKPPLRVKKNSPKKVSFVEFSIMEMTPLLCL